jgi:hypothetical protein
LLNTGSRFKINKMRKYSPVILLLILFILDWFALNNITAGNEPDLTTEYIIHTITSVIVGYLVTKKTYVFFYNLQKAAVKSFFSLKYHIHHDFVGLLLVVLGFLITPLWLQITIAGVGVGLIIHHTQTEGFKLITKF